MARPHGVGAKALRSALASTLTAGLAAAALAQPAPRPQAPGFAPAAAPAPPRAAAATKARTVLFLMPALDQVAQSQLRDALLAQYALTDAELVFQPVADPHGSLGQRVAQVQGLAPRGDLLAAIWVEPQPDGRWLVYMMDGQSERIVVRPLDAQDERRPAAIEAVAVMAKEAARALIEGGPEALASVQAPSPAPAVPAGSVTPGSTTAAPPPTPQAGPAPAAPAEAVPAASAAPPPGSSKPAAPPVGARPASSAETGAAKVPAARHAAKLPLRLSAAYAGSHFDDQAAWRSGAAVSVSWLGFAPLYAGASYLLTWPITLAPAIEGTSPVKTELQRIPATLYAGYRLRWGKLLSLDGELGLVLEWLLRTSTKNPQAMPGVQQVTDLGSRTRLLAALAPRLRAELQPLPRLGLFVQAGVDILLNKFKYTVTVSETAPATGMRTQDLLRPASLRPVAEAGAAVYF